MTALCLGWRPSPCGTIAAESGSRQRRKITRSTYSLVLSYQRSRRRRQDGLRASKMLTAFCSARARQHRGGTSRANTRPWPPGPTVAYTPWTRIEARFDTLVCLSLQTRRRRRRRCVNCRIIAEENDSAPCGGRFGRWISEVASQTNFSRRRSVRAPDGSDASDGGFQNLRVWSFFRSVRRCALLGARSNSQQRPQGRLKTRRLLRMCQRPPLLHGGLRARRAASDQARGGISVEVFEPQRGRREIFLSPQTFQNNRPIRPKRPALSPICGEKFVRPSTFQNDRPARPIRPARSHRLVGSAGADEDRGRAHDLRFGSLPAVGMRLVGICVRA